MGSLVSYKPNTHVFCHLISVDFILRRCDNGTEFKGEVLELCKKLSIKVVNGKSYHPQTQGTVEVANKIFKARLAAVQAEEGTREWLRFLPIIGKVINSTPTSTLPRGITPFEAWFGRPPVDWSAIADAQYEARQRRQAQAQLQAEANGEPVLEVTTEDELEEPELEDTPVFLTELGKKVKDYSIKVAERMIKKKGGSPKILKIREIVLL